MIHGCVHTVIGGQLPVASSIVISMLFPCVQFIFKLQHSSIATITIVATVMQENTIDFPLIGQSAFIQQGFGVNYDVSKKTWLLTKNGEVLAQEILVADEKQYINLIKQNHILNITQQAALKPDPVLERAGIKEEDYADTWSYKTTGCPMDIPLPTAKTFQTEEIDPDAATVFTKEWLQEWERKFDELPLINQVLPATEIRLQAGKQLLKQKPYALTVEKLEALREITYDNLMSGVWKDSNASWCAPGMVIAKNNKQEGTPEVRTSPNGDGYTIYVDDQGQVVPTRPKKFRFVVNLKDLNDKCEVEVRPLPNTLMLFDQLTAVRHERRIRWYNAFDLVDGFHQLALQEESQKYTTFITQLDLLKYGVMPMGWCNAPGIFHHLLAEKLEEALRHKELAQPVSHMVDDFFNGGETLEDCKIEADKMLEFFHKNGLRINVNKCVFGAKSIKYLGYNIKEGAVSMNKQTLDSNKAKIRETIETYLKKPQEFNTDVQHIQKLHGLLVCYGTFVHNFAQKVTFLTDKLKKDTPQRKVDRSLSPEDIAKIWELHAQLENSGILAPIDQNKETKIYTDASEQGYGMVATQADEEGQDKIIFMHSNKHIPELAKSSAVYQELYAIAAAITYAENRVDLHKTTLYTDSQPAIGMVMNKGKIDLKATIARLVIRINASGVTLQHIAGKDNHVADALSRQETEDKEECIHEHIHEALRNSKFTGNAVSSELILRLDEPRPEKYCPICDQKQEHNNPREFCSKYETEEESQEISEQHERVQKNRENHDEQTLKRKDQQGDHFAEGKAMFFDDREKRTGKGQPKRSMLVTGSMYFIVILNLITCINASSSPLKGTIAPRLSTTCSSINGKIILRVNEAWVYPADKYCDHFMKTQLKTQVWTWKRSMPWQHMTTFVTSLGSKSPTYQITPINNRTDIQ